MKKVLLGAGVVLVLLLVGGFFWVRSVLAGDSVRVAIAAQISKSLGQPVTIGTISATAYPRVTVHLGDVRIGEKGGLQFGELLIGTNFRALLSRRIEHATLRLNGARITLPLPPMTGITSTTPEPSAGSSPVELVSIDEIILSDVQLVSGGRTLRGDIELAPQGITAVEVKKIALTTDDATITATGHIENVQGPVGELSLKATKLNFDNLMAFANDFAAGAGLTPAPAGASAAPVEASQPVAGVTPMNLVVTLDADQAVMGQLVMQKLTGRAFITEKALTLNPVAFDVFGGKYDGTIKLSLGASNDVAVQATLKGVDVAAATAFAGSPNTMTGRLSGHLDVTARGADGTALANSAKGTLRVDVTDGVVKNLGLVHAVVLATSMRSGAMQNAAGASKDEPFSKLGATLAIANGVVSTNDFSFVSKDLNLLAQGSLQLQAAIVDLRGKLQLSDELSKQAGQDLVRYTQEQGRVTLPATITGPSSAPSVRIDMADATKRAITNAATEQAQKQLKGGLSGLFKK